jgi:Ca2+-binding RTX toxin-like protein
MASDVTAPSLVSITTSSTLLDIDSGQTTITVTARFTDDLSGLFDGFYANGAGGSPPQIWFVSPSGKQAVGVFDILNPVSGDRLDGVFKATVKLSEFAEAGTWTVQSLSVNDEADNKFTFTPQNSAALSGLSFTVQNRNSDTTAPRLESVSLSDTYVDVNSGETGVIVTARFTDNRSGLFDGTNAAGTGGSPPQIWFVSPSGQRAVGVFDVLNPTAGTRNDGYYKAKVILGPNAEPGVWRVESFLINDEAGNSTSGLGSLTQNLSFQVSNGNPDITPPTMKWLNVSPAQPNVDGTTTVVVTAHLTDPGSGLFDGIFGNGMGGSPSQIHFRSSSGQMASAVFDLDHPLSGDRHDGVFQATITLGSYAQAGRWNLWSLTLADEAGNSQFQTPQSSSQLTGARFSLGSDARDVIGGTNENDAIYGFSGNDHLTSGSGNDRVDGGDGNDLIVGGNGAGNDTYIGGTGTDTIKYTSATAGITVNLAARSNHAKATKANAKIGVDQISGVENIISGNYDDHLYGDGNANEVRAGKGNDRVDGRYGDDRIFGGAGNDILIGGRGKDTFVFDTKWNGKTNVDKVSDFNVRDDVFWFDNAAFTKLGKKGSLGNPVTLSKNFFKIGEKASDKNDYLIYSKKTGVLSYDTDGSGSGKAVEIAKLTKNLKLSYGDFFII